MLSTHRENHRFHIMCIMLCNIQYVQCTLYIVPTYLYVGIYLHTFFQNQHTKYYRKTINFNTANIDADNHSMLLVNIVIHIILREMYNIIICMWSPYKYKLQVVPKISKQQRNVMHLPQHSSVFLTFVLRKCYAICSAIVRVEFQQFLFNMNRLHTLASAAQICGLTRTLRRLQKFRILRELSYNS